MLATSLSQKSSFFQKYTFVWAAMYPAHTVNSSTVLEVQIKFHFGSLVHKKTIFCQELSLPLLPMGDAILDFITPSQKTLSTVLLLHKVSLMLLSSFVLIVLFIYTHKSRHRKSQRKVENGKIPPQVSSV